jgi:hypothetical protein
MNIMILLLAFVGLAQTASIKDIPADQESETTISISKNSNKSDRTFEVIAIKGDLEGEPHPMRSKAKESWQKACDVWKAEVKDLNKENRIVSLNCGAAQCVGEGNNTLCRSQATGQVRVPLK